MVPVAAVDDHRLLPPEATSGTGRIHGGVAAAVDGHPPSQFWRWHSLLFGQTGLFEETHRIGILPASRAGISTRLARWAPMAIKTASKPPSSRSRVQHILHLVVEGQRHPGRHDAGHLPIQHIAGQAVSGNTETQHAARQRPLRGSPPDGQAG